MLTFCVLFKMLTFCVLFKIQLKQSHIYFWEKIGWVH